jgi:hypothetical protein
MISKKIFSAAVLSTSRPMSGSVAKSWEARIEGKRPPLRREVAPGRVCEMRRRRFRVVVCAVRAV